VVPAAMARIAADVAEAESVPVSLLGDYLQVLMAVAETGRRLTRKELEACCHHGEEAAGLGVPVRAVVDAYLTVTWQAWDQLPAARAAGSVGAVHSVARAVLRAADDAAAALADGYERAQRISVRREEALRREFIDDLLAGRGDLEQLVERAERFGLRLGGHHVVAVATAEEPLGDATGFTRRVEAEVLHRFGGRDVLVATKAGVLVCVVPAADGEVVGELAGLLRRLGSLRVGVGRPRAGPTGVARSYEEAREALELADHLGLDDPVVEAASLLVYRVLLRDRGAIAELVDGVLAPLAQARGGAQPLLDTLAAYFQTGGVAAETARRLHLGVRTVTYRLDRVRALTGYSATDPAHRFTLEAAVLGARLLDWPTTPIQPVD
jgi:GGDEF-like domain/PucR C-terminal helix-turn-helix domain